VRYIIIMITFVSIVDSINAQNLDLNNLTDAYFREKAGTLADILPFAIGGIFTGDVQILKPAEFRISINNTSNGVPGKYSSGVMEDITRFSIPLFYVSLGLDERAELSGKFSASNMGNRAIIVTGYGLRYKSYTNESGDREIISGFMINALRGPEDFRIWDATVHLDYIILGNSRFLKISGGADFSEMRISTQAGGNLLNEKKENIARSQPWVAIGIAQNASDNFFIFFNFQKGDLSRMNSGIGLRF